MCAKMSARFSRDFATFIASIVFPEPWKKLFKNQIINNSLISGQKSFLFLSRSEIWRKIRMIHKENCWIVVWRARSWDQRLSNQPIEYSDLIRTVKQHQNKFFYQFGSFGLGLLFSKVIKGKIRKRKTLETRFLV